MLVYVFVGLPSFLVGLPFRHSGTTVVAFLVGTAIWIVQSSFGALSTALLYFDLTARSGEPARNQSPAAIVETGDPLAPDAYTDENRPRGWYIDPSRPHLMRYWAADDKPVWSQRTVKTPDQTLAEWHRLVEGREERS